MTTAYVLIDLEGSGNEEGTLAELIKLTDEIKEARATYGNYDILLKIETAHAMSLGALLVMIRKVPGVRKTYTLVAIPEYGGIG